MTIFIIAHLHLFHHFLYLVMWFRRFLKSYFIFLHSSFFSLFSFLYLCLFPFFDFRYGQGRVWYWLWKDLPSFNISFYLFPSFIISFFFIILFTSPTHFRFIFFFFFFLSVSNFQSSRHSYLVQLFLLNLLNWKKS